MSGGNEVTRNLLVQEPGQIDCQANAANSLTVSKRKQDARHESFPRLTIFDALVAPSKILQKTVSCNRVWRAIANGKLPAVHDAEKSKACKSDRPLCAKALSKV